MPEILTEFRNWSPLAAAAVICLIGGLQIRTARRNSAQAFLDGLNERIEQKQQSDDQSRAELEKKLSRAFERVASSISSVQSSVDASVAQTAQEIGEVKQNLGGTQAEVGSLVERADEAERLLVGISAALGEIQKRLSRSQFLAKVLFAIVLVGLIGYGAVFIKLVDLEQTGFAVLGFCANLFVASPSIYSFITHRTSGEESPAMAPG